MAYPTESFGETYTYTTTDTAALLATAALKANDKTAVGVFLTVETNSIRIAFGGAVPTQAGLGHLILAGESFRLPDGVSARSLQIISASAGQAAEVQITPIFEL